MMLLISIVITSMWCNGLHVLGEVNDFAAKVYSFIWDEDNPKTWAKPLIGCINCMASVHGAVIYFLLNGIGVEALYELPLLMVCCVWLNGVLYQFDA
jgi:hypothetical protein